MMHGNSDIKKKLFQDLLTIQKEKSTFLPKLGIRLPCDAASFPLHRSENRKTHRL